jgi:hypothetical protein
MKMKLNFCLFTLLFLFIILPSRATEQNVLIDKDFLDPEKISYLEQNWSEKDRQFFYFTDQGTRFISYDIFVNIEQYNNSKLFSDAQNLMRFGYIPATATRDNPDGLPIGFTRNKDKIGFTCAACHTQQLRYKEHIIRIDGGQSMADFVNLRRELERSMLDTLNDAGKFKRLTRRIIGEKQTEKAIEQLRNRLKTEYTWLKDYNFRNKTDVDYGYSRLDAFGAILNKGLFLTRVRNNFNPPNAPTSYPYLWDTPQHDYVEWNGSQSNSNVGALARNVGEVIGVFGEVNTTPKKWLFFFDGGYESSIHAANLRALEMTVAKLYSPEWPQAFPPIDQAKAAAGRPLYAKYCGSCHENINRTDTNRKIKVRMSSLDAIKTDPLMAKNALLHTGSTGIFEGKPRFYKVGDIMGDKAPALFIVNNIMVGVLKNNFLQAVLAKRDAKKLGHGDEIHPPKYLDGKILEHGTETSDKALLAYKARPLNGIWSGGPYLHNGSVPNLYQLLLPAEQRDKNFYIGSWEYDPVNVGYSTKAVPGAFLFDTTLPGNSNSGHDYGTGYDGLPALTDDEIWAIVEYMKTL